MIPEILHSEVLQTLKSEIGNQVKIISVSPVSGGDINQAFKIQTQKDAFFLKYNFLKSKNYIFLCPHRLFAGCGFSVARARPLQFAL